MQRKLIIKLRTSTTLLCHPELEGAFSAGTKGVSITAGIRTTFLHGKAQEKTVQRKLIIKLRRSTTLLWHPELEGAFSAGTIGVSSTAWICTTSLFLFSGPCERSTPFPLRPYEFSIFLYFYGRQKSNKISMAGTITKETKREGQRKAKRHTAHRNPKKRERASPSGELVPYFPLLKFLLLTALMNIFS